MKWLQFAVLLVALPGFLLSSNLESITDAELEKLIEHEKYVVVLFGGENHPEKTEEIEIELAAIREDLVDTLNAWVVKAEKSSELKKLHAPDPEPAVVFFRDRAPVVYDGPVNEEEMLEILMRYKEQCTEDLTDTSFEHLTQAATGATTGDWFIHFHSDDCEACRLLTARLEAVACRHKGRINVARVNRGTTGAVTGRRFGVVELPTLIFLRLGRMYRYEVGKFDVESMSSFITGWYKNAQAESIPLPKSPFDDFLQLCVDYLREYPLLFALLFGIPVLLFALFSFLMSESDDGRKKKSKSKKAKSTKKKEQDAKKET